MDYGTYRNHDDNLKQDFERLMRIDKVMKAKLATIPVVYFLHPNVLNYFKPTIDPIYGGIEYFQSLRIEYSKPIGFYTWRSAYFYASEHRLFSPETRAYLIHKARRLG